MNKIFFLALFACSSLLALGQTRKSATACGSGCTIVTAKARNDHACGGDYDYTYTVTNYASEALDIQMFVEKRNGEWKSLGLADDVASGKVLKDAFWSCGLSGRYILFYRATGTNDRFPTEAEVNNRARGY